jgi:hypothetical protein
MGMQQHHEAAARVGRLVGSAHEPADVTIIVGDARLPHTPSY